MNRRSELCRNFQRGSCQYGARCKFLHPTQQQPPNPYGFGVQNPSQTQSGFGFGANNQSQQKASERGNRFLPLSGAGSLGSRQSDSQPQVANHVCNDPNVCKQQIVEDFKNERPLWKLTCYGHWKYLPCDISGDISYEELRFAAYDDAKRGLPLQQIVQREMSLCNSKIEEFNNLLRSLYKTPSNSSSTGFNSFLSPFAISSQDGFQNNKLASVPSVGLFGSTASGSYQPSTGFGTAANTFGSGFGSTLHAFGNQAQISNQSPPSKASVFPTSFPGQQNLNSSAIGFGANNSPFGAAGASQHPFSNTAGVNSFNHQNSSSTFGNNAFSSAASNSTLFSNFGNQAVHAPKNITVSESLAGTSGQPYMTITSLSPLGSASSADFLNATQSGQTDIWLKDTWGVGEIPEDEPPPYARR